MHTYTVTVAQAKAHLSEILGHVERGQDVIITKRGKPIAHIEAIKKKAIPPKDLKEFRKSMPAVKTSSTKLLRKMRDEGY